MVRELRQTGISVIGEVPWGTHFCHFYETKQDLLDTLVPYFKTGLESKEYCLWAVSDPELISVDEAKRALAEAISDFDSHLTSGNIEVRDAHDWYLEKNVFSLERVTVAWDAKLKQALALGYEGMRVSGDTFWLSENDWKDFAAYEHQLADTIIDRPMTVLCTYPLTKSGAAEILDVAHNHQFAIARRHGEWEIIESLELTRARTEIKRLNEALSTTQQLRALSARLQSAREEEATRIARELHDEMGSTLTSLRWELERVDKTISEAEDWSQRQPLRAKIREMMGLTDTTIDTMRRIASELRPGLLDDLGLGAAIEWQAQQFQARTGIACHCDCSLENVDLSEEQGTAVFRILQEALTNVIRHAQATRVDIKISEEENRYFYLSISDNGKGITESEKSQDQSLGILGMRERAHLIGAEIDIKGVEGQGTVVTVRVPISIREGPGDKD